MSNVPILTPQIPPQQPTPPTNPGGTDPQVPTPPEDSEPKT